VKGALQKGGRPRTWPSPYW